MPISKQSISEEFEKILNPEKWTLKDIEAVKSFYDTQIKQLLEEIVPKIKQVYLEFKDDIYHKGYIMGYNRAIAEIKERIKKAGY